MWVSVRVLVWGWWRVWAAGEDGEVEGGLGAVEAVAASDDEPDSSLNQPDRTLAERPGTTPKLSGSTNRDCQRSAAVCEFDPDYSPVASRGDRPSRD